MDSKQARYARDNFLGEGYNTLVSRFGARTEEQLEQKKAQL